jgi:hypothetical protein
MNKIIYDAIYASLPDDCKLTFAQMFENFNDLCPFKAPLSVNGKKFDFEKHVLDLLTDAERAEWWCLTVNHLKWKYIDAIKNGVKKAILFVFGRLTKKCWPAKHKEALQIARDHIRCTEGRVVVFKLEIVTCDHFSSLFFGREDKVIVEMQEALKKSQGGILEGRTVDHRMLNYNRAKIIIQERNAINAMVRFSGRWTREVREEIKLSSLSTDEILKSVYSYFTNWSENIAKDASCRCGFQIIVCDITVQLLTVYFAHRGGKGNLGKKRSVEHCAKISKANLGKKRFASTRAKMTGRKRSAPTRAKMSEAKMGKKHSAASRTKISEVKMGKKHTAEQCAKISEANMGKKRSAATRARAKMTGRKRSAATRAKISEANMGKKRSATTRAKMTGRKHFAVTRAKISEAKMERSAPP